MESMDLINSLPKPKTSPFRIVIGLTFLSSTVMYFAGAYAYHFQGKLKFLDPKILGKYGKGLAPVVLAFGWAIPFEITSLVYITMSGANQRHAEFFERMLEEYFELLEDNEASDS